jgi:hypothetical protein
MHVFSTHALVCHSRHANLATKPNLSAGMTPPVISGKLTRFFEINVLTSPKHLIYCNCRNKDVTRIARLIGFNMRLINKLQWQPALLTFTLAAISCNGFAVSPGATQQAIGSIQETAEAPVKPLPKPQKGKPLTKKQRHALIRKILESKGLNEYLIQKLKHPYYSDTAKSVYTPVGTPMHWGGVGFASDTTSRYPSQLHTKANTGLTAALPFGDSEYSVGGAISAGTASFTPILPAMRNTQFGNQGSVGLMFSRWFGKNTIATAGVANLMPWGDVYRSAAKTYYGALTQLFAPTLQSAVYPISASLGLGTGSFNPIGQVDFAGRPTALNDHNVSVFANAAINLTPNLAFIGDYYSETFAVGLSYTKVILLPFNFMLYAGNLRHCAAAPSTTVGLRIALGLPLPG